MPQSTSSRVLLQQTYEVFEIEGKKLVQHEDGLGNES
jgi:hypothetical protein